MPWGLRIRNQDRVIQFAEDVICPVLVSKGNATATVLHPLAWFSGGGYNLRYVDLTYSGYRPILALRVTDLGTRVKRIVGQTSTIRNGNGTWTTRVFVAWLNYNNWPDDPVAGAFDFQWFVFDRVPQTLQPGWQLRLRNPATGALIYSSKWRLMNIARQTVAGRAYAVAGVGYFSVNEGVDSYTDSTLHDYYTAFAGGSYQAGGSVFITQGQVNGNNNSGAPWHSAQTGIDGGGASGGSTYLILDVTGQ